MGVKNWSRSQGGVLPGARTAPPIQDGPQQAVCKSVTADGVVFVLDATPDHSYGPALWCLGGYATPSLAIAGGFAPRPGDKLLVHFAGSAIGTPWIGAWTR